MRLCYIGPAGRQEALQAFLSPGVVLETCDVEGPVSIESMWEEYLHIPYLMDKCVQLEREGFDAIVPGCFADPGLDGVRELVSIPIVGPGASSMLAATALGHKFGILTVLENVVRPLENLALLTGVHSKLASIRHLDIPVLELNSDRERTFRRAIEVGQRMVEEDRADVLVLGCGTLSFRAHEIEAAIGVPVINPLRCALRTAELLVRSGLTHSKRSYPVPPKLVDSRYVAACGTETPA
jgi:allantoin racemase